MLMRDVAIGAMVFTEGRFDDEIRETYYTRVSEDSYLHHGCIQGSATLGDGDTADNSLLERAEAILEKPRYINVDKDGFRYTLIGALPVKPIAESRFVRFAMHIIN